jgi:hypothetical protein
MATDEAKKMNALRMTSLSLEVLAAEIWDTLGESSMALANGMGDAILEMVEKEQGLEIAGEDPVAVGKEINRILSDEYGYTQEITMVTEPNVGSDVKAKGCLNTTFCDKLIKSGVKTPFTCPIMLLGSAALRQMGLKYRITIDRWPEGKGCIIHYKRLY